jgi:DNA-binding transcriptional MerR regulator
MSAEWTIGRLAKATGIKPQTIRWYEEVGLLPPPPRTAGDQRRYTEKHRSRLAFIRHARELGFSLDAVRELLELAAHPETPCHAADAVAHHHLDEVRRRIVRLQALERELERMIDECRGGTIGECRIIEVLGDHRECLAEHHRAPVSTLDAVEA